MVNKGAKVLKNMMLAASPSRGPGGIPISPRSPNQSDVREGELLDGTGADDVSNEEGKTDPRRLLSVGSFGRQTSLQIADEDTAMKEYSAEKTGKGSQSAFGKFMSSAGPDATRPQDFDAGVSVMALMCALILGIPFQVIGTVDSDYLDFVHDQLSSCRDAIMTFEELYTAFRVSFLATVYWSLGCMILAAFYFVFKRTDAVQFKAWQKKARWLVMSMFLCVINAICSLVILGNLYFAMSSDVNLCSSKTSLYVLPGMSTCLVACMWGFYLIL